MDSFACLGNFCARMFKVNNNMIDGNNKNNRIQYN